MKLKHAIAASAAALLASAALAAGPGDLGELDNTSIDIGNTHGSKATPFNGAFSDVYTFDLVNPGYFKGGLHTTLGLPFGITEAAVSLSGGSLASAQNYSFAKGSSSLDFLVTDLASGHYTLTVTGSVFGGVGSYGGDIAAVTAAVPEPASLALVAAGLGMMVSLRARRRSQA